MKRFLSLVACAALALGAADPNAAPPARGPLRLLVILVDPHGVPRIADALTCPADVRVFHSTGTANAPDWLRYSFTPHAADETQHWKVSF